MTSSWNTVPNHLCLCICIRNSSLCVENIRKRLTPVQESRMMALVRSANDSSSDIAIYCDRAHGFLPKAPIKRDKVCETLAPMWFARFPQSQFGETMAICVTATSETEASGDVACTPFDITEKIIHIESLFASDYHVTDVQRIHEQMHELKG